MPVQVSKTKSGKYRVSTPGGIKAKGTTKEKAKAQTRLLNAVEHGWKPTGKPIAKRFKKNKHTNEYMHSDMTTGKNTVSDEWKDYFIRGGND